jgi:hypothetical protein
MRTTVTLEPDVAKLLEDEVHCVRKPFKQVLNDAVRRGLSTSRGRLPRYRTPVHMAEIVAVDPGRLNALADELEDEALLERRRASVRS